MPATLPMEENMGNPRRSNGARRDAALRWLRSLGSPCHICGLPIDYGLPPGLPRSFECDEVIPVAKGGSCYHRENLAASHRICNGWKSDKTPDHVTAVRNAVAMRYGGWDSPEDFAAKAKAVEASGKPWGDAGARVRARTYETTTEW